MHKKPTHPNPLSLPPRPRRKKRPTSTSNPMDVFQSQLDRIMDTVTDKLMGTLEGHLRGFLNPQTMPEPYQRPIPTPSPTPHQKERTHAPSPTLYDVLQVSPSADPETIAAAYRSLSKRFHPDNQETGNEEKMKRLQHAYQVLSNPVDRKNYDKALKDFR